MPLAKKPLTKSGSKLNVAGKYQGGKNSGTKEKQRKEVLPPMAKSQGNDTTTLLGLKGYVFEEVTEGEISIIIIGIFLALLQF